MFRELNTIVFWVASKAAAGPLIFRIPSWQLSRNDGFLINVINHANACGLDVDDGERSSSGLGVIELPIILG